MLRRKDLKEDGDKGKVVVMREKRVSVWEFM